MSAQAGWRQLPMQIYLMHAAAAQGDYTRAVRHLDAILRQSAGLHHYPALIDVIENNVAAQDAFEKLLMTRPPWFDVYTNDVGALSAEGLSVRALILADLHDRGMSLGCDGIDAITHELVLRGNAPDGYELWRAHCPAGGNALMSDGHLSLLSAENGRASEFRWHLIPSGDLATELLPDGKQNGQVVQVANHGAFPQPFIRKMEVFQPGRYMLRWTARTAEGGTSTVLTPNLSCGTLGTVTTLKDGVLASPFTIPAECGAVWLEFHAQPQAQPVFFGNVSVDPAP